MTIVDYQTSPDSYSINNYQKPKPELVKWKKLNLEESLDNLKQIVEFITQEKNYIQLYCQLLEETNSNAELIKQINSNPFNDQQFLFLVLSVFNKQEQLNIYFEKSTIYWENLIKKWLKDNQKDVGSYLWPLRVCLSGKKQSPSPFELLSILNQEEVIKRSQSLFTI